MEVGKKTWAIAEGYIPGQSASDERALVSHETACLLNTSDRDANVAVHDAVHDAVAVAVGATTPEHPR